MATFPVGAHLSDFEILGELGRGGMGVVYRARQMSLDREVALKVLPDYAQRGRLAVRRFRAEAQAAARLHHTNIVPIYAQGESDGHFFYAMELIEGVGLETAIHHRCDLLRGPGAAPDEKAASGDAETEWTPADYRHVAALMAEVAEALECAHRHGVIHRDVKPHNLLLSRTGRLHLTDFGLARLTDAPHLTMSGELMGTPAYLSPEQVRGDSDEIDHRTDIYSLGATLYEVLTRRKPFEDQTRERILSSICQTQPAAPRRLDPAIPIELETICLRAMEKAPARRYASAADLAEDLRRFAQGRPILARRPTLWRKAARWVDRHRAATVAGAVTAVACVLCVALLWSVWAARQREARQLLSDAYERLAYVDYHSPDIVAADVERAEQLGADEDEVHLVRALICLGHYDQPGAIERLTRYLERHPADERALYMLAWAQWRAGDRVASQAAFEQAAAAKPPTSADAWFFRGLAAHFDDASIAIECYREAIATLARQHAFYPQAVLHLARARNQQLYAARSLEGFSEAVQSLEQLVEHQQYGAYPYYLLSIAHRLAAEIYAGSSGTRGDALVDEHYAAALDWAARGQAVDPQSDRPIVAEAECLESVGRFAEAIDARTRALEVATQDVQRWEAYHFRWRLNYWVGRWQAALDDLAAAADYDPENRYYTHVYPALVLAEMGRHDEALGHARAPADETPDSAPAVIWSATCLRLLGQPEAAAALLAQRADAVDFAAERVPPQSEQWVAALYELCRDGGAPDALEALATDVDAPWRLWGEACFHAAAERLAAGDRTAARAGFERAYRCFDGERRYTYHAKLIRVRLQQDPAWPAWVSAASAVETPAHPPIEPHRDYVPDQEGGL